MKYTFKVILIAGVMLYSGVSFADILKPAGEFAIFKDAKVHIKGNYEGYCKHFTERDLNGYNGNETNTDPLTGEDRYTHTDLIERWMEHELRLYPAIFFNDKLELHLRFDAGGYIFQGDAKRRLLVEQQSTGDMTVLADNEKFRLKETYIEMITPVGLFIFGRFSSFRHGITWGGQIPKYPKVFFGLAWTKTSEGKWDTETEDIQYYQTKAMDYMDRDDQNYCRYIIGYNNDNGFSISHMVTAQLHGSKAKYENTALYIPQLKIDYNKGNFHLYFFTGFGIGTLYELPKTELGSLYQQLLDTQKSMSGPRPELRPSLNVEPANLEAKTNTFSYAIKVSYDIGDFKPFITFASSGGADNWNEISGFGWEYMEPKAYRTPRILHSLLFGEIDDKYFPVFNTLATQYAYGIDTISFNNIIYLQIGTTYRISDKLEFLGHILAAQRETVEYFENSYWDFFPVQYALNNMSETETGDTMVPLLLMKNSVNYYTPVDPFMGVEFHGNLTCHLFDGFDVSLLFSYLKAGNFYKDVLSPKEYVAQVINMGEEGSGGNQYTITGPYLAADKFELTNAWSVQLKMDFKFDVPL